MKSSLVLSSVLFAGSLLPLSAQEGKIEAVEPVDGDPDKPQILLYDKADDAADDEDIEETDEEDPDVWFPGDRGGKISFAEYTHRPVNVAGVEQVRDTVS